MPLKKEKGTEIHLLRLKRIWSKMIQIKQTFMFMTAIRISPPLVVVNQYFMYLNFSTLLLI